MPYRQTLLNCCALAIALVAITGCANHPSKAQNDTIQTIQRNIDNPQGCKRSEVRYCSAHGSRGEDGLCMCLKQRDAEAALEDVN